MLNRILKSITIVALVSIAIGSRAEDVDILAGRNATASGIAVANHLSPA